MNLLSAAGPDPRGAAEGEGGEDQGEGAREAGADAREGGEQEEGHRGEAGGARGEGAQGQGEPQAPGTVSQDHLARIIMLHTFLEMILKSLPIAE